MKSWMEAGARWTAVVEVIRIGHPAYVRYRVLRLWFRRHRTRMALRMIRASVASNYLIATIKLVIGILTFSPPAIASAVYNTGIGLAKHHSVHRFFRTRARSGLSCYRTGGLIVTISSALYLAFAGITYALRDQVHYTEFVAIGIALIAFVEITVALKGALSKTFTRTPLVHANKLMNVASACISLALTQTAILSFTTKGDITAACAAGSGALGGCSLLIGVGMMLYPTLKARHSTAARVIEQLS